MISYTFSRKLRRQAKGAMLILGISSITVICGIGLYHYWQDQNSSGPQQTKVPVTVQNDSSDKSDKVILSEKMDQDSIPEVTSETPAEKKPDKPKEIVFEGRNISAGNTIKLSTLQFTEDKAIINSESYEELNNLARFLKDNPKISIEIQGHTDKTKNKEYSISLSLKRAEAVKDYLLAKNVKNDIRVKGYGFTRPIAGLDADDPANRRVEIRILSL